MAELPIVVLQFDPVLIAKAFATSLLKLGAHAGPPGR